MVYAVDEAALRTGLAGEALARARALIEAVQILRNGQPRDLATAVIVDRALELVKAGEALISGDERGPGPDVAGDCWTDVIFGRIDWLTGARSQSGEIVPSEVLESPSS